MKKLRRFLLGLVLIGLFTGTGALVYLFQPLTKKPLSFTGLKGNVQRGAYLARASGCFACHTKKKGPVLAGGDPVITPFGTFYAPNITMHLKEGIGKWTLENFSSALTHGLSPKGESYYPVFLYPNYTKLSAQDVIDLWAAFRTVPPNANKAPDHNLKFPFQFRFLLRAWKRLFFEVGSYEVNKRMSDEWNRGAFLATGPAHCVACHSPRNILGARDYGHELNGSPQGPNGEKVPPITATALLKKGWTKKDIVFSLRTGSKPDGDVFGGTMGEVMKDSTRFLSDSDLNAIAEYILSIEYIDGKSQLKSQS